MVDVALIIVMCITPIILSVINALMIIHYQNKLEATYAIVTKVIIAIGLLVGEICVLMLPFDVANTTVDGGLPTSALWISVYIAVGIFTIAVFPFLFIWHQGDVTDLTGGGAVSIAKRVFTTIITVLIIIAIFAVVCIAAYVFFGVAEVHVTRLDSGLLTEEEIPIQHGCPEPCGTRPGYVSFRVSPVLFIITVIDFIGYLILIVFGSVGLASVPYDLFWGFVSRPHALTEKVYNEQKALIYKDAVELIKRGEVLRDERRSGTAHKTNKQRTRYNKWRTAVELVDKRYKQLELLHANPGGPIVMGWVKLAGGILATIFSLCWVLHILLYLIVPGHKLLFLNGMFIAMNEAWTFLGTIAYGLFAFYLLLCVILGLFKFGLRFFCIHFYPMEKGDTPITSFAFNAILIMIGAITVTHFCTVAFSAYAENTDAAQVFVESIGSLRILRYFFTYSVFAMVLLPFVAIFILFICKCHHIENYPAYYYENDEN